MRSQSVTSGQGRSTRMIMRRAGICQSPMMCKALGWAPSKFKVLGAKPSLALETMCWSHWLTSVGPLERSKSGLISALSNQRLGKGTRERAGLTDYF